MNILFLNYEFPPLGGGAGNATYNLFLEYAKNNDINIDLVTSSVNTFKIKKFSNNIKIHCLDIGKNNNLHHQTNSELLSYSQKSYAYCKALIKTNNFDLIHAFFGIPCGYIAMKLNIPYIISLRGSDVPFYNERFFWLDKFIFKNLSVNVWKNAEKVIANSEYLKDLAKRNSPNQQINVIHNGIDTETFIPDKKENNKEFTIISTSRLIRRKGIEYLIDAFIEFNKKHKNTRLILAGGGDLERKFKSKINKNRISDFVEFAGSVDHNTINKIYNRGDVFVLPSLNEGMSNSLLEAMASGLAVISTNTGGTKELLSKNNGIIINKRSIDDIINGLEKLFKNQSLLKRMKNNNRKIAESLCWNNISIRYLDLYDKCANMNSHSAKTGNL